VKNLHHGANHKIDAKIGNFHMDTKVPRGLGDDETKYMEAPVLIAPHWDKEFHVHIDISNVAIGAMLTQNINNRCDQLIRYDHGSSIMQIVNIQLQSKKHWQWFKCFTNSNITFLIISFSFM
jgi:hypothetical protein